MFLFVRNVYLMVIQKCLNPTWCALNNVKSLKDLEFNSRIINRHVVTSINIVDDITVVNIILRE